MDQEPNNFYKCTNFDGKNICVSSKSLEYKEKQPNTELINKKLNSYVTVEPGNCAASTETKVFCNKASVKIEPVDWLECNTSRKSDVLLKCEIKKEAAEIEIQEFVNNSLKTDIKIEPSDLNSENQNLADSELIIKDEIANKKIYSCKICEFTSPDPRLLTKHMRYTHVCNELTKMFHCTLCHYKGKKREYLKRHMLKHQPNYKTFNCTKINTNLQQKQILRKHKTSFFSCYNCSYKTKQKTDLQIHIIKNHQIDLAIFKCDQCDKFYKRICDLQSHVMLIHKRNCLTFNCQHCKYSTTRKDLFSKHFKLNHQGKSPTFTCSQSGYFKIKYLNQSRKHVS